MFTSTILEVPKIGPRNPIIMAPILHTKQTLGLTAWPGSRAEPVLCSGPSQAPCWIYPGIQGPRRDLHPIPYILNPKPKKDLIPKEGCMQALFGSPLKSGYACPRSNAVVDARLAKLSFVL